MHPFRDGNGRTQCEVIRVLALINVDGQDNVYKQYMNGTVYLDVKLLESLISSLMEEIVE
nr:Fic family protein [Enterococcus plantarum]